jgi:hypothetical protein
MLSRSLALAAIALLLVGCGSGSDGMGFEHAANATSAESARFEMRYEFPTSGESNSGKFAVSGAFDFQNELGVMRDFEESAMDALGADMSPVEVRYLQGTVYTRWDIKGKSYWVKEDEETDLRLADPTEALVPFPGGSTTPTDVLELVLRSSADVRVLGSEEVRGIRTTHYRGEVDPEKLLAELPLERRPGSASSEDWRKLAPVPIEVWVDEEGRVRRIDLQEDIGSPEALTSTFQLYDFGVEVDVRPPPADELVSQEELNKLMGEPDETLVTEMCFEEPGNDVCTEGGKGYFCDSNMKDDPTCAKLAEQFCAEARRENPKEAEELCAAARKEFE